MTNHFLIIFSPTYKNVNRILSKTSKKDFKKACEKYQNLSDEEKKKKHQYAPKQYRNLFVGEKHEKHQHGREWYRNLLEHGKKV